MCRQPDLHPACFANCQFPLQEQLLWAMFIHPNSSKASPRVGTPSHHRSVAPAPTRPVQRCRPARCLPVGFWWWSHRPLSCKHGWCLPVLVGCGGRGWSCAVTSHGLVWGGLGPGGTRGRGRGRKCSKVVMEWVSSCRGLRRVAACLRAFTQRCLCGNIMGKHELLPL